MRLSDPLTISTNNLFVDFVWIYLTRRNFHGRVGTSLKVKLRTSGKNDQDLYNA